MQPDHPSENYLPMRQLIILSAFLSMVACQDFRAEQAPDRDRGETPPKPGLSRHPEPEAATTQTVTSPAMKIHQQQEVIFDFERPAHVARWMPSYISKKPFQAWNERYASKGAGSMAFDLDAHQRYPGVRLDSPGSGYFNWSRAQELRFDIFNPQDNAMALFLRIDSADVNGQQMRSTEEFALRPGPNLLRFALRNFGAHPQAVAPARIKGLILFAIKPEKTLRLYLDEFRLAMAPEVEIPVENVFLFDFGPRDSAVMAGFTGVTHQHKLAPGKAFGFTKPPYKTRTASYRLDSLADDSAYIPVNEEAEFTTRLPNGRYTVGLFIRRIGDLDLPVRGWEVLANGKLKQKQGMSALTFYSTRGFYRGFEIDYGPDTDVWEEFAKDHVPFYRFETDVKDGELRLKFKSCAVHAMMIWPAGKNEWGSRLVEQVQRMRRDEFYRANFWLKPIATAAAGPGGPVLAPVSYLENIHPDFIPQQRPGKAACSISAAPGEREPAALAFRPDVEYRNVTAQVSDFTGDGGTIPASAATVYLAKLFPRGKKGAYELQPLMLEPAGGQTLRANVTREFWIDVHVPEDAAPGNYRGEIALWAENRDPLTVEVNLTVRPFRLASDSPVRFAMFYGTPASFKRHYRHFYKGDAKWEEVVDAEMRNMAEHGFNTLSIWGPKIRSSEDGGIRADFSDRDRLLKLCRKHGLARRHDVVTRLINCTYSLIERGLKEFSPEFNKAYKDVCRQTVEWARKNDLPMLFYVIDEPRERDLNWWNRNLADTLKYLELLESIPNARTYIPVMGDKNSGVDYSILAEKLDVVATHPARQSRRLMAKARELCIYNAGQDRLSWGFYVWKIGARGRREWGYQWIHQPYNPFDSGNDAVAYPSPVGLLPTIGEKRIREGIDDYRYIYTLEKHIARARAAGTDVSSPTALLARIRKAIPDYLDIGEAPTRDLDYKLDAWREQIAEEIQKLVSQAREQAAE